VFIEQTRRENLGIVFIERRNPSLERKINNLNQECTNLVPVVRHKHCRVCRLSDFFIIQTLNLSILANSGCLANNTHGSSQEWLGPQRILIEPKVAWKRILKGVARSC